MRILQLVTRSEPGGAQSVVAGLAQGLVERGHEVAIASGVEGNGEAWSGLDARIERMAVKGLMRAVSPLDELRALRSLSRIYRDWAPDIVHVHTSKAAALGRLAWMGSSRRIVYTMHGYDQLRRANRAMLPIDKALRFRTGTTVAVSRSDLAAMKAEGYRAVLVPNGVADAKLRQPLDASIATKLTELRRNGLPVALLIARGGRPKRPDLAREAAQRLRGIAEIAWIGGDARAGDPPNFHAFGAIPDAASYLGLVDIFLLLSDHEGMPMSLLEAFSAGLPSVASAVGGVLECLGPGEKRGIGVANEVGAVVAAVEALAANAERRTRMGSAARSAWEREYSLSRMVNGYIEIYWGALDEEDPSRGRPIDRGVAAR